MSSWLLAWSSANVWRQRGVLHLPNAIETWRVMETREVWGLLFVGFSPWHQTVTGETSILAERCLLRANT